MHEHAKMCAEFFLKDFALSHISLNASELAEEARSSQ